MPERAPVLDEVGEEIARTERLPGDEGDDILHGIVVRLAGGGQRLDVPADRIPKITTPGLYRPGRRRTRAAPGVSLGSPPAPRPRAREASPGV